MGRRKKTKAERREAHLRFEQQRAAAGGVNGAASVTLTDAFRGRVAAIGEDSQISRLADMASTTVPRVLKIARGQSIRPKPGELEGIQAALDELGIGQATHG